MAKSQYDDPVKRISHLVWFAILLLASRVVTGTEVPPLTCIAEIRALSREQTAKDIPVRVRGVVTWGNSQGGWFTILDDTAGLGVDISLARGLKVWRGDDASLLEVRVGVEVEIRGVIHAAGFAPVILPQTLQKLGEQALPEARPMSPARFFCGADACERIEVRGVVQGFQPTRLGNWSLLVNANPGRFSAEVPTNILPNPQKLVDAQVCLRGVAATGFNSRREVTGIRLLISQASDLVMEKPPASSPFDAPRLPLNQLMPFHDPPSEPHRKLVEGTVTYAQAGQVFYIQEGETAVRVETLAPERLQLGDRVQVAGFVDMRRQVAGLDGAVVRKIGTASVPQPENMSPSEIMALNTRAATTGQAAQPCDYDGHLITFHARLMDVQQVPNPKLLSCRLIVQAGGTIVEALLQSGTSEAFKALQPGSKLQVTGIAQLDYSERQGTSDYHSQPPTGINVLLPGAENVTVLEAPSWWTPEHLMSLLAAGIILLAGALFWMWQLRRQLARKTMELAVEMRARRDAAVEFKATLRERTRLAANLHDTLLQSISALNYQLEACEAESLPRSERKVNYLASARRIVQHALQDLRGTVWALRVLPLDGRPFAEALRALASQLAEGHKTEIIVRTDGALPPFSDFVAGNLLLVAQEAMHNALKHSQPSRIETTISPASHGRHITLEVRDDGAGFDMKALMSTKPGHFGLEGMRERVERLGGKLRIESVPRRGTTVRAEVFLDAFDKDIV
jgi:signal transduction histidine kinase